MEIYILVHDDDNRPFNLGKISGTCYLSESAARKAINKKRELYKKTEQEKVFDDVIVKKLELIREVAQ